LRRERSCPATRVTAQSSPGHPRHRCRRHRLRGEEWLFGFDGAERSYFRHTFPIAVRERRLTATLPGATALGVYVTLVALVLLSRVVRHRGHAARWVLLGAAAMFVLFLTGQRGIQIAGLGAGLALVVVALLRPG